MPQHRDPHPAYRGGDLGENVQGNGIKRKREKKARVCAERERERERERIDGLNEPQVKKIKSTV